MKLPGRRSSSVGGSAGASVIAVGLARPDGVDGDLGRMGVDRLDGLGGADDEDGGRIAPFEMNPVADLLRLVPTGQRPIDLQQHVGQQIHPRRVGLFQGFSLRRPEALHGDVHFLEHVAGPVAPERAFHLLAAAQPRDGIDAEQVVGVRLRSVVGSNSLAVSSTSATTTLSIIGTNVFSVRRWPGRIGSRRRPCSTANGPPTSAGQASELGFGACVRPKDLQVEPFAVDLAADADRAGAKPRIALETQQLPLGVSSLVTQISTVVSCPSRLNNKRLVFSVWTIWRPDSAWRRAVVWVYPTRLPCSRQRSQDSRSCWGCVSGPAAVCAGRVCRCMMRG